MPEPSINKELDAIRTIADALSQLEQDAQQRVLEYAIQHLGIKVNAPSLESVAHGTDSETSADASSQVVPQLPARSSKPQIADIRSLKEQKQPQSDVQMAVVVAYYLSELAPVDQRKVEISTSDLSERFKQANYPLPKRPEFTLPNAKQAGYLDSVGHGKYKLNPVGHNLVAHNLPKQGADAKSVVRRRKKPSKKKTTGKKKTTRKKSTTSRRKKKR